MIQPLTKFQSLALPLVERGFAVTPVRVGGKGGALKNWQIRLYRTPQHVLNDKNDVDGFVANCNVGVVGQQGVGKNCFLDDDGGVPRHIIDRLPRTYTVATRPDSVHRHYYFTQTEYSVKKLGKYAKTINVRDTEQIVPSPSGGLMYKTLFDMKGIGGASLVVAAGSTKSNDDVYTCVDDGEVAPIPNWLVDWIRKQRLKYRVALNRIRREHLKAKRRAAKTPPEVREKLRAEGHADGFDIFPIDRSRFVKSQAFKFARLGVTGDALVEVLIAQISRYVEGGTAWCSTELGKDSLRRNVKTATKKMAESRSAMLLKFYDGAEDAVSDGTTIHRVDTTPTRRDVFRLVMREFPDRLTCEEAKARLEDGLDRAGLEANGIQRDRNALCEIRKEEGFEAGTTYWTRRSPNTPTSPLPSIRCREGRFLPACDGVGTVSANALIDEELNEECDYEND